MREYKFREWDKMNNKLVYDVKFMIDFLGECHCPSEQYSFGNWFVLMQYTGLKDMNNKEIYEGDIVKVIPGNFCEWEEWIGKIIYNYASFWVENSNKSIILDNHDCILEIIGNIYENPKLLENE